MFIFGPCFSFSKQSGVFVEGIKVEGGHAKEREGLLPLDSSSVQPQCILGMVVEVTCLGLPFFGPYVRQPRKPWGNGSWAILYRTHEQEWQCFPHMLCVEA